MKILSCHVFNFGGLRSYQMDFDEGLNIILHDNGWGKSTLAAYIKTMLYGMDNRNLKGIVDGDRKRYKPWQGGQYGGNLDIEADGKKYRIVRLFGETAESDSFKIIDLETNETVNLGTDNLGEYFFHLDAMAFQRSVFVNQNGIGINGGSGSIHTRLNSLVGRVNDLGGYDYAIKNLTDKIKKYEKPGQRGLLADITKEIKEKEEYKLKLDSAVAKQDEARERAAQIDKELVELERNIFAKREALEKLSKEEADRESLQRRIDELNGQISDIQLEIESIQRQFGGIIPAEEETKVVLEAKTDYDLLQRQLDELNESISEQKATYNLLMDKYSFSLPTAEELDEIQNANAELQVIINTDDADFELALPDNYALIKNIETEDPTYVDKLRDAIDGQNEMHSLDVELGKLSVAIANETETWADKKNKYRECSSELEYLEKQIEEMDGMGYSDAEESIRILENLQREDHLLALRAREAKDVFYTAEEERLMIKYIEGAPDEVEARDILNTVRDNNGLISANLGLNSQLKGELSRVDSLKSSISLIADESERDVEPLPEPKKPATVLFIALGIVALAGAAAAAWFVDMYLAASGVLGLVFLIVAMAKNKSYKAGLEEYRKNLEAINWNQECKERKEELDASLSAVLSTVESIQNEIHDNENAIETNNQKITGWSTRWLDVDCSGVTENLVNSLLDELDSLFQLKQKQDEYKEKAEANVKIAYHLESVYNEIVNKYPELLGKSIEESIDYLKMIVTEYKRLLSKREGAIDSLEKMLALGLTADDYAEEESHLLTTLKNKEADIKEHIREIINNCNEVLSKISLNVSEDNYDEMISRAKAVLGEYSVFDEKQSDVLFRREKRNEKIEEVKSRMSGMEAVLHDQYSDMPTASRLTRIREEVSSANAIASQLEKDTDKAESLSRRILESQHIIDSFIGKYNKFNHSDTIALDDLLMVPSRAEGLFSSQKQLIKQVDELKHEMNAQTRDWETIFEKENELRSELKDSELRRESLKLEHQEKIDTVRMTDGYADEYQSAVVSIRDLYNKKQAAQSNLETLKRAKKMIMQAKENLGGRYQNNVEQLFNSYMSVWINDDHMRGVLDHDFNIKVVDRGETHTVDGYSKGYCDMLDFCMRLALIDTLFTDEQPFIVLDDPFINLDESRLAKALELLNMMADNKQIIYLVCHPIRALEVNSDEETAARFSMLAAETRKELGDRKQLLTKVETKEPQALRYLYNEVPRKEGNPIKLANCDYVITRNMFSLELDSSSIPAHSDGSYELFFIDKAGNVLNNRQVVEISNGKLSTTKVWFNINPRGSREDMYELMIREKNKPDYEIIARTMIKADLS